MSGKDKLEAERLGFIFFYVLKHEEVYECFECKALVRLSKCREHYDWHLDLDIWTDRIQELENNR